MEGRAELVCVRGEGEGGVYELGEADQPDGGRKRDETQAGGPPPRHQLCSNQVSSAALSQPHTLSDHFPLVLLTCWLVCMARRVSSRDCEVRRDWGRDCEARRDWGF